MTGFVGCSTGRSPAATLEDAVDVIGARMGAGWVSRVMRHRTAEGLEQLDHSEGVPTPGFDAQLTQLQSELHPERNEDTTLAFTKEGIFGIFDGREIRRETLLGKRWITSPEQLRKIDWKLSLAQIRRTGNIF
jgi:hypothetical protein